MDSDGNRSVSGSNESLESFVEIEQTYGRSAQYDFPKVELHCHLDGCFRLETVIKYAVQRKIELPTYDIEKLKDYCVTTISSDASLDNFLENMGLFTSVFKGCSQAIRDLTIEAIEDKAKQGIVYCEMRYCPQLLCTIGEHENDCNPLIEENPDEDLKPSDVVRIVNQAIRDACQRLGTIKIRTILCCIVPLPMISMDIARLCVQFKDEGVVGIDIAGSENYENSKKYKPHYEAFAYCKKHNVHRTAHAGEAQGAKSVEIAIDQMSAERIGHGYHVLECEATYRRVLRGRTHFECCPISSYRTGSCSIKEVHPLVQFVRDGMNTSISTDDPGLMLTTLLSDYDVATEKYGFSEEDLKNLNLNAARSSFLPESEKEDLVKMLMDHYC